MISSLLHLVLLHSTLYRLLILKDTTYNSF